MENQAEAEGLNGLERAEQGGRETDGQRRWEEAGEGERGTESKPSGAWRGLGAAAGVAGGPAGSVSQLG